MKNGKFHELGDILFELIKAGTETLSKIKDQCKHYRGIAVTNTLSRTYCNILKNKIKTEINQDAHLVFVDLQKNYDAVNATMGNPRTDKHK